MKRIGVSALLAVALLGSALPSAHAVVTPGSKCSKAGVKQTYKGLSFSCVKSRTKLIWSNGVKVETYDAAFARSHLLEAQAKATKIIEDARTKAVLISSPPNCTTRNSIASISMGGSGVDNLLSLIFSNSGICDITVQASAAFLCPDGRVQKTSNYVTSTGIFPLRAGEKLSVSLNASKYFPQVLNDCRLLTGYSSNFVNISTYHQRPSVITLTSNYSGNFNQAEATKKATKFLATEKARADKIISDAKNPILLAKLWVEVAKKAAAEKAAAEKAAADRSQVCTTGGSCRVGNTGPGGGIVFYDAGIRQSWGRYLEVAPKGWSGSAEDPEVNWCPVKSYFSTQIEIGTGKPNTDLVLAGCQSGAAVIARSYKGGGKDDWFLPSKDELNELYKYARTAPGGTLLATFFLGNAYWSSSESSDVFTIWTQYFDFGSQFNYWDIPRSFGMIRPVRAF